ncbi:MAG TPA: DUF4260 domain-containing protein [Flavobacteriales bacterium]|nr:DUF4260 domain-containing protein [Flavobacteriales bacterium]
MKILLRLEELAQFLLCLSVLVLNDVPWWVYPILLLGPDIGMLGYLHSGRVGAITYNLFHHKGIALLLVVGAALSDISTLLASRTPMETSVLLIGVILYGHASMDRALGYGLKFGDHFQHTHLGWIGKLKGKDQ